MDSESQSLDPVNCLQDPEVQDTKVKVKLVAHSCPTLCDPMNCSPPGSSIYGIFQARILEWVAISFSGDLPNPGTEPRSPALRADSKPAGKAKTPKT